MKRIIIFVSVLFLISNFALSQMRRQYTKWIGAFPTESMVTTIDEKPDREGLIKKEFKDIGLHRNKLKNEVNVKPVSPLSQEWIVYISRKYTPCFAEEGEYLWIGTAGGGLVKLNKLTGNFIVYDKWNSGLPDNWIWAIAIDGGGNKWIGTYYGGLAKFDGVNWTVYNTSNSGLPSNYVWAIAIDGVGNKWIGTDGGGLAKFDGVNWTVYNTSNSGLPDNDVLAIAIDGVGNKWIGTFGGGLAKFDGVNWTVYNTSNSGLPDDYVWAIAIDGQGNKWVGTWFGGLVKFDGVNWTVYNTSNSNLPYNIVLAIAIDGGGNKWIGTWGGGLAKFDGVNWTVYNTSNSGLPSNYIIAVAIDNLGNKWVGNRGGELVKFDGVNFIVYNISSSGLPDNSVTSIAIDLQSNKWIGTYGGGVAKFDGVNWVVYNESNSGLPDNWVRSIATDGGGNKWIGTYGGGLAKFDGVNWTVYNTSNSGLPDNWVYAIAIDGGGNKWIGTWGGGLAKFDGVSWTVYNTLNSGLPDNDIFAIAIDGGGNKWIGTWGGGLAKFDGVNWTVYNTSNSGLPDNWVYAIAIDGVGNKWIGTWGGGLAKFDGVNWTVYNTSNSGLPLDYVYAIAIDDSGNKWIGTAGGGVAKFDGVNWTVYNTSNSNLPYNIVLAIAIDGGGNKWIGTAGGGLAVYREGGAVIPSVKSILISFDQINSSKFPKIDCYVTVTDSSGNPITGLADTNFVVYEDNVRELPITVTPIGTTQSPISVAIVIDRSGSMSGQPISDAKTAASSFVDNLKPSDRASVISFNQSVSIDQPFTSDKNALKNAINSLSAGGMTAIYDAAYTALSLLSSELNPRKAIILLTDGADNSSSFTPDSVIKYANFLGIPIHTIGLGLTPGSNEENALKNLSKSTGGRYFYSPTSSQLIDLYNLISQQIQAQYLITYVTHNSTFDNTLRKVRVVVNYQSMSNFAERSYRAPGSTSWSIKISSKVDSLSDLNNFAAVHSLASDSLDPYDIPKPPAPNSNYVYLYFPHPEWGGILGPNYSKDTRKARDLTNETIEWLFNVKTDRTGKNVLLEFNPDSLFPSNYTIVLYDLDAGTRKVLSQSDNTYIYNSGSGGERHFKLVVGGLFKTRKFQAGWNLVGIPLSIDSTLSSMFSDDVSTFYIYTYTFKEGYKIDTTFTLGRGFWLGLLDSAVVDFSGTPVKDTISTNLDKYWNIISTPYLTPITKGNIFVERSGVKIPFDSAVSSGWISRSLFGYDPRTKSYYLSDTLEPWLGYWFATLKDSLKLIYTPSSTAPSPKVIFADVKSDDRNWNVILSARLGDVLDKLAFFGVRDGASDGIDRFDYPKPPLPPGEKAIQVYFYHPEWNFELGPYFASDIRASFGDVKSWKFYVRCLSGGEVKLSWDLSQVRGDLISHCLMFQVVGWLICGVFRNMFTMLLITRRGSLGLTQLQAFQKKTPYQSHTHSIKTTQTHSTHPQQLNLTSLKEQM
jgi:VWFA-related protein